MNVTDVNQSETWKEAVKFYGTEDPFELVFARQRELLDKYLPIEEEVIGIKVSGVPVDIHSPHDQVHLKQRAWWVTEEVAESFDALINESNRLKAIEELADALHFMIELLILVGIEPTEIKIDVLSFDSFKRSWSFTTQAMHFIGELGMAIWQLRNKPWKQNQILTDRVALERKLKESFRSLWILAGSLGLNHEEIALIYLAKSEVNKFRIRTNY